MAAKRRFAAVWMWVASVTIGVGAVGASRALAQADEPVVELPITRAVLFSSGVGYFEHAGEISGAGVMRLRFKTDQINDVLKSMVLMDFGGGTIQSVSYASNDPLSRALSSFAINLSDNPSLPDILGRLRGAEVVVHAPNEIRGKVLNVELRQKVTGDPPATVSEHILHLVTATGIRSVALETVDSLEFADAKLREELNKALALLMSSHDKDSRPVDIRFTGQGTRAVRIGYLVETPVWKTTYRLDLSGDKPLLQGWAITENTSDNDWNGVTLSLVSGRPISFIQDLYTPLYLDRPVVQPRLMAFLRPRMYEEGMAEMDQLAVLKQESRAMEGVLRDEAMRRQAGRGSQSLFGGREMYQGMAPAPASVGDMALGARVQLGDAVQAAASAGSVGELFSYTLKHKIDLARRRSAMLPIINQAVDAERVSIYNPRTHATHPLNGVRITNDTDMKLLAGPVTVFDGGMYAGDAQIDHLAPGDKRLLSYAVDLSVTVDSTVNSTSRVSTVRIIEGVMQVQHVHRFEQTYAINNKAKEDRLVMIEHPFVNERKLIEPEKYEEKTPEYYRFRVPVKAETAGKFVVREEQPRWESIAILSHPTDSLMWYVNNGEISKQVREALARAIEMKQELSRLETKLAELTQQVSAIQQGQERLRQNINTVGQASELGRRYLRKLAEEEDQIEALEEEIQTTRLAVEAKRGELATYLKGLRIG